MKLYIKYIAICLLTLGIFSQASAVTCNWTGAAADANWHTAGNWHNGIVPGSSDIAVFSNLSVTDCNINSFISVGGMTLSSTFPSNRTVNLKNQTSIFIGSSGLIVQGGKLDVTDGKIWLTIAMSQTGGIVTPSGKITVITGTQQDFLCNNVHEGYAFNMNYKKELTILGMTQDESLIDTYTLDGVEEVIVYTDGLGNTIQTVNRSGATNNKDIVTIMDYDDYGRNYRTYVPYVASTCDGSYKTMDIMQPGNAYIEQYAFYTSNTDNTIPKAPNNGTEYTYMFAEEVYENFPTSRVIENIAPGDIKFYSTSVRKTKRSVYSYNAANEVLMWNYDHLTGIATAKNGSNQPVYYPANTLAALYSYDEDGSLTISYANSSGQIIAVKQTTESNPALVGPNDFNAITYTIYDAWGHVVYTLQPNGTQLLSANNYTLDYTTAFAKKYAFGYKYDERGRQIEKRLPGSEPEIFIYNRVDLLVLTQDGKMRQTGQWHFMKYDYLRRLAYSGLYLPGISTTQLRSNSKNNMNQYECPVTGATYEYYSNSAYPTINNNTEVLQVNYYDNYDVTESGGIAYTYSTSIGITPSATLTRPPMGMATVSKERSTGSTDWLIKAYYYDPYLRLVQVRSNSLKSPQISALSDAISYFRDFTGKVLFEEYRHSISFGSNVSLVYAYGYDNQGRLLTKQTRVNNGSYIMTFKNVYNVLGVIVEKNLHSENGGTTFLQSLDYRTDMKGRMISINNTYLSNNGIDNNDNNDLFGMNLYYEKSMSGINTPSYAGNLSAVSWRVKNTATNNLTRAYLYSYNDLNWLKGSEYREYTGTWSTSTKVTENNLSYDRNGNILTLKRTDKQSVLVDDLSYVYDNNTLLKVQDNASLTLGFVSTSTAQALSSQYTYDERGSLIADANKSINFAYDHNNLLYSATAPNSASLSYQYTFSGVMVTKTSVQSGVTLTTNYILNAEYQNNVLKHFNTGEGRIELRPDGQFYHVYYIKDNLGSIRVVFEKGSDGLAMLTEENNYYAFGYRHANGQADYQATANSVLAFNGKEVVAELGLNYYNFGARMYDASVGRFFCVDPMASDYGSMSVYTYAANNPVTLLDVDGKYPDVPLYHRIQPGESYWSISQKYGIPMNELINLNQAKFPVYALPIGVDMPLSAEAIAMPWRGTGHTKPSMVSTFRPSGQPYTLPEPDPVPGAPTGPDWNPVPALPSGGYRFWGLGVKTTFGGRAAFQLSDHYGVDANIGSFEVISAGYSRITAEQGEHTYPYSSGFYLNTVDRKNLNMSHGLSGGNPFAGGGYEYTWQSGVPNSGNHQIKYGAGGPVAMYNHTRTFDQNRNLIRHTQGIESGITVGFIYVIEIKYESGTGTTYGTTY